MVRAACIYDYVCSGPGMPTALQIAHGAIRAAESQRFRGYMGAVAARRRGEVCVSWDCDSIVDVVAVAELLQIVFRRGTATSYCMVAPETPQTAEFAAAVAQNWKTTRDAMRSQQGAGVI